MAKIWSTLTAFVGKVFAYIVSWFKAPGTQTQIASAETASKGWVLWFFGSVKDGLKALLTSPITIRLAVGSIVAGVWIVAYLVGWEGGRHHEVKIKDTAVALMAKERDTAINKLQSANGTISFQAQRIKELTPSDAPAVAPPAPAVTAKAKPRRTPTKAVDQSFLPSWLTP